MSLCQSLQYALGICAICFLMNGISSAEEIFSEQYSTASKAAIEPEGRALLFNPRVDYNNNQWTPVGHSDPLKNDPTFDYVPPSGIVRYWAEQAEAKSNHENSTTNATNDKSEILLLGAPVEHSLQSNHLPQPEVKSANRRSSSSPYYPAEPSRILTPPSAQAYTSSYDQSVQPSDYYASASNYWSNDLPVSSYSSDAFPEESASYVTVIRPKTNPHPYASTIYNKNIRNSIYHLAANVNSLEPVDKRPHWVQSLLQKEITYQPQSQPTTPSVVVAYSPSIYEPQSTTNVQVRVEPPKDTLRIETNEFAEPITSTPMALTTDSFFSHYKQPVLPVRGPMYLIIQGHSKVKTYGPQYNDNKKEKLEAKMVPVIAKEDSVVKHVVPTDANGSEFQVKHLHKLHTPELKPKIAPTKPSKKIINSPMESLLSLLDSSLASFGMNTKDAKTKINDLKRTTERLTTTTKTTTKPSSILGLIFGPTTIRSTDS